MFIEIPRYTVELCTVHYSVFLVRAFVLSTYKYCFIESSHIFAGEKNELMEHWKVKYYHTISKDSRGCLNSNSINYYSSSY